MRLIRRFTFAALLLAALVVSSVALGAGGLAGTYKATITNSGHLNGKWVVVLTKSGTYTVSMNGNALARGRYSATATAVTFDRETGSDCSGAGVYAWKTSGKTVTFVRKRETASCRARAAVLTRRFTQVR
jgi:hypothetical protein